jgi:hypothetical protein
MCALVQGVGGWVNGGLCCSSRPHVLQLYIPLHVCFELWPACSRAHTHYYLHIPARSARLFDSRGRTSYSRLAWNRTTISNRHLCLCVWCGSARG